METLSRKKRTIYLIILAIVFVIGAPLLVLYSIGYRFDNTRFLVKTGGITVYVDNPNATVYINNTKERDTNFFQKTYFFQNIKPGNYNIRIEAPGMFPWESNVHVFPEYVSEAYALIVPEKVIFEEVLMVSKPILGADSGGASINEVYSEYLETFAKINHLSNAGLSKVYKNIIAEKRGNNLSLIWNGKEENAPYYFCGFLECSKRVNVALSGEVLDFDFFPHRDDVFLILKSDGLYALAIDSEQNVQWFPLYVGTNLKFYIEDRDVLYVKDKERISRLQI